MLCNRGGGMIKVENLRVSYGRGKKRTEAVRDISFEVKPGECVGYIGANGAGKSTTIKTLMGFVYASAGKVILCGCPAGDPAGRREVGYLPETTVYYPFMKANELLMLYGRLGGMSRRDVLERRDAVLEMTGLAGHGDQLLKTFSKGMQQRLGIAQALITNPQLLILDEVSSGLDPLGRYDLRNLLQSLKDEGRTIFFSSHELSEVESLCDRVLLVHQGRLIRDITRDELMAAGRERSLESFFIETVRSEDAA